MYGKASFRSTPETMGTDMIPCDTECGGLFHKTCVGVTDDDLRESDFWYCPACTDILGDEKYEFQEELPEFHAVHKGEDTLPGLIMAMEEALDHVTPQIMERGFETMEQYWWGIIEAEGGHDYEKHWRKKKKQRTSGRKK
jgi:hypothetical protein